MCEYCSGEKHIINIEHAYEFEEICIENGSLITGSYYGGNSIKINYCPMCGSKLSDNTSPDTQK
jgi:hypothetical protein